MKLNRLALLLGGFVFVVGSISAHSQNVLPAMKAQEQQLKFYEDGIERTWSVSPQVRPDILRTNARQIKFRSKTDSIAFSLREGDVYDFVVITAKGDSAFTRVERVSNNPLQNPPAEILGLSSTGKMSRRQAVFDINALVYNLGEIHPNMYAQVGMKDFMQKVNRIKAELPDSLTKIELYERTAPLVTILGDGHTMMRFPFNGFLARPYKRLPLSLKVDDNTGRVTIIESACREIPDSVELLSINGFSAKQMVEWMMQYVSGERDFFRRERINSLFTALFEMRYSASQYDVEFLVGKQSRHVVISPMTLEDIKKTKKIKYPSPAQKVRDARPYFYEVSNDGKYALLTFRACDNSEQMALMADSMVAELNNKGVKNLIIDVRENGGGNSRVGDELLRRISPVPFMQYSSSYVRITPSTLKISEQNREAGIAFYDSIELIEPLAPEKRFSGKVYLLISHATFSSGSSFSWACSQFNIGTIVGEETGGMNVCFGDVLSYRMPVSGILTTISFKRFWQYGANEHDIHGTLPHYKISADKALDYVMKRIKAKK